MNAPALDPTHHREFLNRYYGVSRHFYDATRKYYLFGRDRALSGLLNERWRSLVEVGPGTGRNLRKLHRARPYADLGGLEASDAMLSHARARCPWARLRQGFAESGDLVSVLGRRPERILFSYCLSMIARRDVALARARAALAPGGEVVVVDFADLDGLPGPARRGLDAWLRTFHVDPLDVSLLERQDAKVELGPFRYFVIARFGAARP